MGRLQVVQFGMDGGVRSLADILADEQRRVVVAAVRMDENAQGAALLRTLLDRIHVVAEDGEVALLRVLIPLHELDQLELWGAAGEDDECDGLW